MGYKTTQKYVYDHDYLGLVDGLGKINQVWGETALNQSIKLWFASLSGDIIRNPKKGGVLTPILSKPMTQVNADTIKMAIKDGIYQDFKPLLTINKLEVKPNYEERYWYIYVEVYSQDLKLSTTVEEKIKAKV